MPGRPRKSDKMKELTGTLQKCRVNEQIEITAIDTFPKYPADLDKYGKKVWGKAGLELFKAGLLNNANIDMFKAYCYEMGVYLKLKEELTKEDLVITIDTADGKRQVVNAKIKLADMALKNAKMIAVEFGLTPISSQKINGKLDSKHGDDYEEFKNSL